MKCVVALDKDFIVLKAYTLLNAQQTDVVDMGFKGDQVCPGSVDAAQVLCTITLTYKAHFNPLHQCPYFPKFVDVESFE